jgi:hypothetical protein
MRKELRKLYTHYRWCGSPDRLVVMALFDFVIGLGSHFFSGTGQFLKGPGMESPDLLVSWFR